VESVRHLGQLIDRGTEFEWIGRPQRHVREHVLPFSSP
jgi:hypothetical protein